MPAGFCSIPVSYTHLSLVSSLRVMDSGSFWSRTSVSATALDTAMRSRTAFLKMCIRDRPYTLLDYFGDDFLLIIDESHITVPQVGGMYAGDQSRKQTLVDYGFRLPSAKDNRPLSFEEFESKLDQVMFVSATPGQYEYDHELLRAEQIIRPTGLLDPKVEVRPIEGQIDDLIGEVNKEVSKKHKILITTLTKRMAEDLTEYMKEVGIRVRYLHSDIDTLERARIIRDMRLDVFDVLVGINLLREGLDIPEITLVAILDADKEGFLRSETSLIPVSYTHLDVYKRQT